MKGKRYSIKCFLAMVLSVSMLLGETGLQTLSAEEDDPTDALVEYNDAESTVSDNNSTGTGGEADSPARDRVTVTFYDSDSTTELLKYEIAYDGTRAVTLGDKLVDGSTVGDSKKLRLVRGGFVCRGWEDQASQKLMQPDEVFLEKMTEDRSYVISYDTSPYQYAINYYIDGVKVEEPGKLNWMTAYGMKQVDSAFGKSGKYADCYDGWYFDKELTKKADKIDTSCLFSGDLSGGQLALDLYGKTTSYQVKYNLSGGWFKDSDLEKLEYVYNGNKEIALRAPLKSGSLFDGWYLDSGYTKKIEKIDSSAKAAANLFTLELFAKFDNVTFASVPSITVRNTKTKTGGNVKITVGSDVANYDGWEIGYSTSSLGTDPHYINVSPKDTEYVLYNLPKNKTYYFSARYYKEGKSGDRCYSDNSGWVKCKIKYGVTESAPKTSLGKITSAQILEDGTTLHIEAYVTKRVKSIDFSYYLVGIDKKLNYSQAAETIKTKSTGKKQYFTFDIPVRDENGAPNMALLEQEFALAVKASNSASPYKLITPAKNILNPERGYADITLPVPSVTKDDIEFVKTSAGGDATVNVHSSTAAQLCFSTDKAFVKNVNIVELKAGENYTLYNVPKKKKYYFRARAHVTDVSGNEVLGERYGNYCDTVAVTMKYGVTESNPSTSSGKITKIEVQPDRKTLVVEATVSKRLKSYDESYYLTTLTSGGACAAVPAAAQLKTNTSGSKKQSFTFEVALTKENGSPDMDLIGAKYALAVQKSKGKYTRICAGKTITNPELAYADPSFPKPVINGVDNAETQKGGDAVVRVTPGKGIDGWELCVSQDENFSSSNTVFDLSSTVTSHELINVAKDKTYYLRARAYVNDRYSEYSMGGRRYSDYSDTFSYTMTYGVSEVSATASRAKVSSIKKMKKAGQEIIRIKMDVPKRVKSYDEYYYLVSVDKSTGKLSQPLATTLKATKSGSVSQSFTFDLPYSGNSEKYFALAVQSAQGKYKRISAAQPLPPQSIPAPAVKTKKGVQGATGDNVDHVFINIYIRPDGSFDNYPTVKEANAKGQVVTAQLMFSSGANLYAFDPKNAAVQKAFTELAATYSQTNCHIDNWILGNEVNIYHQWYKTDKAPDAMMEDYVDTYKLLYDAVMAKNKNAKLYICVDHFWNDFTLNGTLYWGAKNFIDLFAQKLSTRGSNIAWNIACHPYSKNVGESTFWLDHTGANKELVTFDENTTIVSMDNLEVLTNYILNKYGADKRVIISEIGYNTAAGDANQAAAYAYAYYKAEFNSMVDAFIVEWGAYNSMSATARDVFLYMNTPSYASHTGGCLQTLEVSSWNQLVPGFDANRFN